MNSSYSQWSTIRSSAQTASLLGLSLVIGVLMSCLGCGKAGSEPQTSYSAIENLTPVQQQQKDRALAAKDQLFSGLLGELTKSMAANGPAGSINVCKQKAPEIAKMVSDETGVRIGRTSFKLRNTKNKAPEWAASFVQNKTEKPVHVALDDEALGVLLPIKLQATCALCHGTNQQVMPEVRQAIEKAYPNDKATGFKVGDVRGYFWIEVPQSKADAQPDSESKNEDSDAETKQTEVGN